jgi:hypothetical protein
MTLSERVFDRLGARRMTIKQLEALLLHLEVRLAVAESLLEHLVEEFDSIYASRSRNPPPYPPPGQPR